MTAPSTIPQRFISKPNELGVVAVGFAGGQVGFSQTYIRTYASMLEERIRS